MQKLTFAPLTRNSLVFIDSAVDNYHSLIAGVKPQTETILLDADEDGVAQITAALAGRTGIKSVHIVSHGSPGAMRLGNTQLSLDTIEQYSSQLQQWQDVLSVDANLLLYGCNVAAGEQGVAYLERLKSLVGAEIAASQNLTGSAASGGDWDLEVTTGFVEVPLAFEPEMMEAYASVLATLLNEDFDDANGTTPPPGWTNVVIEGNPETDLWRFDNPGERSDLTGLFQEPFAVYDSDALSDDNIAENIAFESPVFDASDSTGVFLQFDQYYGGIVGGINASEVFVEAFNGTAWQEVYSAIDDASNSITLDLTDELAGVEDAQVRFRFDGNWSYLWAVDNITVVDELTPGVTPPTTLVGVSEDNVPDPLSFEFVLQSRPTAPVTLNFAVDETQLQPIAPLTFTPENWNIPQVSVVTAVADGIAEGNEQTSPVSVAVTSADVDYNGLAVDNITVEITDNAIPGFISYRTVEETFRDLSALAAANSNIASWVDIGDSYDKITPGGSEGHDIYAIQLTNQSTGPEDKPALYVEGAQHAREYSTAEVVTRFSEELVAGYGKDADITWLLDYFEVHVVPIVNPDGRKFAEQGYSWRKNTNPNPPPGEEPADFPNYGVDLNRNWDSKWGEIPGGSSGDPADLTYRGTAAFSEPETQAVRDYVTALFPDQRGEGDFERVPDDATGIFLDVHSYGNLVLYPFGWTSLPSPNKKQLETLGRKFGYYTGLDGEAYDVDQAVGLYPTDGTADDWAYEELGVAGYTLELGTAFFQDTEYFENTIVPELIPTLSYAAKAAYRPYQTPAGPESLAVTVDVPQVVAGTTSILLSATADDSRYDDGFLGVNDTAAEPVQNIAQARYTIDAPSWMEGVEFYTLDAADGAFDSSVETLEATIDTTDLAPGRHTIFVESQDASGNFGVPTAVFVDVIDFSENANILDGTSDNNTLVGGKASDVIYARDGNDTAAGGLGDDLIFGGAGDDKLRGDRNRKSGGGSKGGDDIIYGGTGNDQIGGKGGDDTLYGEPGDDKIWGDKGNDLLWGGMGNDTLNGGGGSDTFVLASGEGSDTIRNFSIDKDLIGLAGTLTFGQLSITQDGDNALVGFDDETLAILTGLQATTLTDRVFTPVTVV